jgi:hypothetical protein
MGKAVPRLARAANGLHRITLSQDRHNPTAKVRRPCDNFASLEAFMPRYYFDIVRDGVIEEDQKGRNLPDATEARAEATVAAVKIVTAADPAAIPDLQIAVRDDSGKVLFEVNTAPWGQIALRLPHSH